ncbi:hypothetical protein [Limoniibacter endophyticus]|uniref:Uncharacterized protein n=1 Tax=Limoniibacter endophyticus TaxID=1565040 RepID=A0A8J3GEN5_9HYPH|nr:hypothetical protein [Limoniibacter endophyticus]GHC61532.1 hypothetical protein GCM10010136_02130 [Limoniibacter endophyticus]
MTNYRSLSDGLKAWYKRPEGEPVAISTNFPQTAANDNVPEDLVDAYPERRIRIRPSVEEIEKQIASGTIERNDEGQIVKIGRLRFSDGNQTEPAYRYTIDGKLERYSARMPTGAMLGASEEQERILGGDIDPQDMSRSNNFFNDVFGVKPRRYRPSKGQGRASRRTAAECQAELDAIYARTDWSKVTLTICPPGLPAGAQRIADSFLGMQKTTCAGGGSMGWEDISTAMVERETWARTIAYLSDRDMAVLDAAMTARSYADVGSAIGQSAEYTRRKGGKKALLAANDNLMRAINLAA